jgi:hypothetical protein
MAIRLVRQTISSHTIRQAIVCTEWPSVWYARLLAPKLFVRPVFFYRIAIRLVRQAISPHTIRQVVNILAYQTDGQSVKTLA